MNNSKYHIAVTRPNDWFAKFLSKNDRDRFCLNSFCSFPTDTKLKKHQLLNKRHGHFEKTMPKSLNGIKQDQ